MKIAAVVLAAGASSRFDGENKLLSDIGGQPLVRRVLTSLSQSRVDDIVVVIGPNGHRIVMAAGPGPWRTVINPQPRDGLSSSLRVGLAALGEEFSGALIVLADMPGVTPHLIDKLVTAFNGSAGGQIVHPIAGDGHQGHPVLWPSALFGALKNLAGDKGGKDIIAAHQNLVTTVPVDSDGHLRDIDTVDDLASFKREKSP